LTGLTYRIETGYKRKTNYYHNSLDFIQVNYSITHNNEQI